MARPGLSDDELARFSAFVEERIGLRFPPDRYDDLRRGLAAIAAGSGFDDPSACLAWILSSAYDRTLAETLAASLTVGETYFFREPQVFQALEYSLLPAIISRRREQGRFLRIWSAGCSTGEEAYSLAIILSRIIPDIGDWSITLLATDINTEALKKAESGLYSEWSFRSNPAWVRDRWFRKRDKRYEINRTIKDLVTFSYLNLAEDAYPALLTNTNAMDLILCRNVLMYFSKDAARATMEKIQRSLVPGGRFIVSLTETSLVANPYLVPETAGGVTTYRKSDTAGLPPIPSVPEILPAWQLPQAPGPVAGVWPPAYEPGIPAIIPAGGPGRARAPPGLTGEPPAAPAVPVTDPYTTALGLAGSGDYAGAETILAPHIAENPDDHKAMALMAEVLANRGDLAGAAVWCRKAIAKDRLNPYYHHLLATIRQEEGAVDEALGELRRALYADPSCIPAHFTLASLKHRLGNTAESGIHFRNALALLRRHPPDEIIEGAGGMSAARLERIIRSITGTGVIA